jgi:hypothetical protein
MRSYPEELGFRDSRGGEQQRLQKSPGSDDMFTPQLAPEWVKAEVFPVISFGLGHKF